MAKTSSLPHSHMDEQNEHSGTWEGVKKPMSRCGSCDLYWPNGKENFGVVCQGDCSAEECAKAIYHFYRKCYG